MELGSLIGFISGIVFIFASILLTANFNIAQAASFVDPGSIMITVGGTIASTLIAVPLSTAIRGVKSMGLIFKAPKSDPGMIIEDIVKLANIARKEGVLQLEEAVKSMDDVFLQKGIQLIVDATDPELVKNIMETELAFIDDRHGDIIKMWEFVGGIAPAWGMIGTLIGLILMLKNLSDPSSLGAGMATALITTFYGSLLSNYLANPVANKMKLFSNTEIFLKTVLIEGILSIQAGDNPRIIEEKLKSFISPALRKSIGAEPGKQDGE